MRTRVCLYPKHLSCSRSRILWAAIGIFSLNLLAIYQWQNVRGILMVHCSFIAVCHVIWLGCLLLFRWAWNMGGCMSLNDRLLILSCIPPLELVWSASFLIYFRVLLKLVPLMIIFNQFFYLYLDQHHWQSWCTASWLMFFSYLLMLTRNSIYFYQWNQIFEGYLYYYHLLLLVCRDHISWA